MPDRLFEEPSLAALYDAFCALSDRGDFGFYLPYVMAARSVLDVGCGTGALLHLARAQGHTGRLVGLDPADAMLDVACTRRDIEWILGDLSCTSFHHDFELVVMTGHAFQVLLDDGDVRRTLARMRTALRGSGRFAFETRNPSVRAWERWTPEHAVAITTAAGDTVRCAHEVQSVVGDRVTFTATYTSDAWPEPQVSWSTLRFLDVDTLDTFLAGAGLVVAERYGDWDRQPLSATSPEIITIARHA